MKLTTRLGIAMVLVSAVTLSPVVLASTGSSNVECGAKSKQAINIRSAQSTSNVITAALSTKGGTVDSKGAVTR